MSKGHHRLKTVGLVILITLAGKMLGLMRDMLLGQTFGTGWQADALVTASSLPRIFFDAVFASAVSASFIPVFNEVMEKEGRAEADRLASSFLTIMGLSAAALTALGMVFAPSLIRIMAPEFAPETAELATRLLTIIFPSLLFTGIAFSMVGILNSLGEFRMPAAMSIASNGILIGYFLLFVNRFGVYGAAVAMMIGWIAQALMQGPALWKRGYRYRPRLRHPALSHIFRMILPVMVSTWTQPINMLVIIWFASAIPGGVSSLHIANGLYLMIAGIFVLSVTNVIFPEMSRLAAVGDRRSFGDMVRDTVQTLLFLLVPMTVGLILMATPLIQLLYEYRQFDANSTALTASALMFMCLGMLGYGVQNVLIRAFYAEKKGKMPLIAGIFGILVNAVLCFLLAPRMGVAGLALASAVSSFASVLVLAPASARILGGSLVTRQMAWAFCKMVIAACCMALVVWPLRAFLTGPLSLGSVPMRAGLVLIPTVLGAGVYLGLAHLLRLREMHTFLQFVKARRGGA